MKRTYSIYAVCTALVLILALPACTAFTNLVKNDALISQLAVEAATARVIHERPSWKTPAIRITAGAIAVIDSQVVADLASIESYVKDQINWSRLQPEEQALVSALISQTVQNLRDAFRAQGTSQPDAQMVAVRQVLQWVKSTAERQ